MLPLVSYTISLISGCLLATLLWPQPLGTSHRLQAVICLLIGIPVGFGITSLLAFGWLLVTGALTAWVVVPELLLLIVLIWLVWHRVKPIRRNMGALPTAGQFQVSGLATWAALTTLLAFVAFASYWFHVPHGEWDAMAMWNKKARFLALGGVHWIDLARGGTDHPDYPLLLPLSIAHDWVISGSVNPITQIVIAFVFLCATAALLASAITSLAGRDVGLVAGIVLLGTPFFNRLAAVQYADIPIGFFVLAAFVTLTFSYGDSITSHRQSGGFALAGLLTGFAAWTKNEGLLFMLAVLGGCTWVCWRARSMRPIAGVLCGLVLPLTAIVLFKGWVVTSPNDLVAGQSLSATYDRLSSPSRYWTVFKAFIEFFFLDWPHWSFLPLLAVITAALIGFRRSTLKDPRWQLIAITLALVYAGYFLTYITTPHELTVHLYQSLHRLLAQLWPSLLLLLAWGVRPVEIQRA